MSTTLSELNELYPNQILIPVIAAGKLIGYKWPTVRNKVSSGTFPVPIQRESRRVFVKKSDLAAFIDRDLSASAPLSIEQLAPAKPSPGIKRGRGRPRKVAAAKVAA